MVAQRETHVPCNPCEIARRSKCMHPKLLFVVHLVSLHTRLSIFCRVFHPIMLHDISQVPRLMMPTCSSLPVSPSMAHSEHLFFQIRWSRNGTNTIHYRHWRRVLSIGLSSINTASIASAPWNVAWPESFTYGICLLTVTAVSSTPAVISILPLAVRKIPGRSVGVGDARVRRTDAPSCRPSGNVVVGARTTRTSARMDGCLSGVDGARTNVHIPG